MIIQLSSRVLQSSKNQSGFPVSPPDSSSADEDVLVINISDSEMTDILEDVSEEYNNENDPSFSCKMIVSSESSSDSSELSSESLSDSSESLSSSESSSFSSESSQTSSKSSKKKTTCRCLCHRRNNNRKRSLSLTKRRVRSVITEKKIEKTNSYTHFDDDDSNDGAERILILIFDSDDEFDSEDDDEFDSEDDDEYHSQGSTIDDNDDENDDDDLIVSPIIVVTHALELLHTLLESSSEGGDYLST
ncbi:protein starmaker-like [Leptopilina heterotoma]|uniref:protein starmaker-like n=1 Tax=Leptopilina heterotoma TaxID=63436 RepID=UPI001CA877C1|nr:protein starmaker-like [Leptopilina heterotoma]